MKSVRILFAYTLMLVGLGTLLSFVVKSSAFTSLDVYNRPTKVANSFDYPVGKPNAEGYYKAQTFGENYHLGDDWNSVTGGNADLGDPVYASANGVVEIAHNYGGGWGNVIRIVHLLPSGHLIESLYAHCDTMFVEKNDQIEKGDQIGTIGNAFGTYSAYLHFEIRYTINVPIGGGYSKNPRGYMDPTAFIKANR